MPGRNAIEPTAVLQLILTLPDEVYRALELRPGIAGARLWPIPAREAQCDIGYANAVAGLAHCLHLDFGPGNAPRWASPTRKNTWIEERAEARR